ncbi:MAG: mandelate racemase/muconate lactonizing enzyme family protein [Chloroflexi bacterium]|nr:mandelate racemase/muconate lactonizing enzyme family protein [Chloroflexota bacterium]
MKITSVKTYHLQHQTKETVGPSTAFYSSRGTLLIKLQTDEGLVGWGETIPFAGARALIELQYTPLLIGRDPREHRRLWRELWGPNFGNGIALGGLDIALHDLRGKALGLSVGELYGGRLRDTVPVYASAMNYTRGVDAREQYPREAEALARQGFSALKMRLGAESHARDRAAAAAVRQAVGPDILLMADGNGAYSLPGAVRMGRELEALDFYWFEEPMPQNEPHYPAYEQLTAQLDIAVAAGEALASRGAFQTFINRRAADIIQPDVSLCGGIGECLFVSELARMSAVQSMPHCWGGALTVAATIHVLSLIPDASWARTTEPPLLELDTSENPFRTELLREPLVMTDGSLAVPTGPGLGVEVDEALIERYRVG